jgi:Phosphotransferase enzyme family
VTLVLVDSNGEVIGQLPSFQVGTPWWQDAGPVVRAARERFGLEVTILRLLETALPSPHGGAVSYLAEVDHAALEQAPGRSEMHPWPGSLTDDPLRRPYARPGGPAADLDWADGVLAGLGRPRIGPAVQDRTWNLSSLWRLPTSDGGAWLKVVPPFFSHEGALVERLGGERVPRVLGRDGDRMLLAEAPGEDVYDAGGQVLLDMIDLLVGLQARWLGRAEELLRLGLSDWRGDALAEAIDGIVGRAWTEVPRADRDELATFVRALPERVEAIAACGIPDSLVHGDFHPGNFRAGPGELTLLDWGDSGVGQPLLDQPAFLIRVDDGMVAVARQHWHAAWRRRIPGSDPDRAARLIAPMAAARQAVIYRRFLDNIEASEQGYHMEDVPDWLRRTAAILRAEREAG